MRAVVATRIPSATESDVNIAVEPQSNVSRRSKCVFVLNRACCVWYVCVCGKKLETAQLRYVAQPPLVTGRYRDRRLQHVGECTRCFKIARLLGLVGAAERCRTMNIRRAVESIANTFYALIDTPRSLTNP